MKNYLFVAYGFVPWKMYQKTKIYKNMRKIKIKIVEFSEKYGVHHFLFNVFCLFIL